MFSHTISIGVVSLGLTLLACGDNYTFKYGASEEGLGADEHPSTGGGGTPRGGPPSHPGSPYAVDHFAQPTNVGGFPVDVIFVTDTSGSMEEERAAVTGALSGFLGSLTGIEDYCVGVLFAHGDERPGLPGRSSNLAGKLRSTGGAKSCLCSLDPYYRNTSGVNQTKLTADFRANFETIADDTATDGGEAGLFSFKKSITNPTILAANRGNDPAARCYRENAALVSVFVADENDISASNNFSRCPTQVPLKFPGPASVFDEDCREPQARLAYYGDVPYAESYRAVHQAALTFQEAKTTSTPRSYLSAVVGYVDPSTFVRHSENEFPFGYAELADLSGGDKVDIALAQPNTQDVFDREFSRLGDLVAQKVSLRTTFDLSRTPCSFASIEVSIDHQSLSTRLAASKYQWNGARHVTILSVGDAGEAGDTVAIRYRVCR